MTARAALLAETIILALWLGAAIFFAAVVAQAAFAVLPTRGLAGALVGRVLPVLFVTGMMLGLGVLLLEVLRLDGWRSARGAAGGVIFAACAVAQLVVGARIERLRASLGGSLELLAADDPRRAAFGRLHAFSVGWLALAMLVAVVALVLAARAAHARA